MGMQGAAQQRGGAAHGHSRGMLRWSRSRAACDRAAGGSAVAAAAEVLTARSGGQRIGSCHSAPFKVLEHSDTVLGSQRAHTYTS